MFVQLSGWEVAHGDAFGTEDIAKMKRESGFDPEAHFVIPTSVKGYFADAVQRGHQVVQEWQQQFEKYQARYPEVAGQLEIRLKGELSHDWKSHIPASFPAQPIATRVSSGLAFKPVAENIASFLVGSADLSDDVELLWTGAQDFQHPGLKTDLWHQRELRRPIHSLRHQRTCDGRDCQRSGSLPSRLDRPCHVFVSSLPPAHAFTVH